MVPPSFIAWKLHWNPTTVFNQISKRCGQVLGGLLNATFGNAVEVAVDIVALENGYIDVVQMSMLGSILLNFLLVLGACFLFGGIVNMYNKETGQGMEQTFASATAEKSCSLIVLSSASLLIPATLFSLLGNVDSFEKEHSILVLSRGTAIIPLIFYALYLLFLLYTHPNLFKPDIESSDAEEAEIGPKAAVIMLMITTVLVAICANNLVESIEPTVETAGLSKKFIGLIIIPIIGNAAEHLTAIVMATRNNMDLALQIAIGSSNQIALLVTPFFVILAWAVFDEPMTLHFDIFSTFTFALSVLVVVYTVQDGKSNYLEGALLLGLYLIIALAFYVSPMVSV
ncbi:calcium/proton exchanger [Colletotrichum orchidophilum]|uniref:Vacuolar calcium ion transporter n=1 Tax=Colletotrichum orchidophilum TaxID=1209926 RepID=A0A1G4AQI3_9PEZI|nr:calcium/proton exchanger [Colletotrichum orchidophilum]OHE91419.1 calcium/proton exchanger [Colletotrichum orchidophilum]